MGALQFFSPTVEVGITASTINCSKHSKTGTGVSFVQQPVHVAVTSDGGRWWRLTGVPAPSEESARGPSDEQLVAGTAQRIWAIVGGDHLIATENGGRHWQHVAFPGPAVRLIRGGKFVWAVTCPHAASRLSPLACRPRLWRASMNLGVWEQMPIPDLTAQASEYVDIAISASNDIVLTVMTTGKTATGKMVISINGGATWHTRLDPSWDGHPCTFGGELATAPPQTFWLLCDENGAAGSSTKGLLESTNSGSTWRTVSAAPSLTRKPSPGSIPLSEPGPIAAGSTDRLWLALTNGLAESDDSGRTWSNVPAAFDAGGWSTTLSVLDATHAWLLAPGAGLWSTADGQHWQPIGPLHTS